MNGVIYFTKISEKYQKKNMEHLIGEKLLEEGLKREYGRQLAYEPRAFGEHGKPFFTLQPKIHYNITHSGKYAACILAGQEVGIDIQEHRNVKYERMLERMVPEEMIPEILNSAHVEDAFFAQWVLREAYIKWTGEGLSKDLRKIPMDDGASEVFELEEGYSCAVWAAEPMEIRWEQVEVQLPFLK